MNRESVSERDFHDLFENNQHIWDSLGYSKTISEPNCDLIVEYDIEDEKIEPDFFAFNELKDRWEIVDLKMPLESLTLDNRRRRKRFKSSVEDYISQIDEYNKYFDENAHREHIRENFSIDIPKDPPVALILGTNIKQNQIDTILKRYSKSITVYQYDNLLDRLRQKYSEISGDVAGLPGISVVSVLQLTHEPKYDKEYILDIGKSTTSDRISLYIQNTQDLVLEVTSSNGDSYQVSRPWEEALTVDKPALVYLEIASSDELSFDRVFVGAEILDEMAITAEIPLNILKKRT
jgi:hypothetical protein